MAHLENRLAKLEMTKLEARPVKNVRDMTDQQLVDLIVASPDITPLHTWRGKPAHLIPYEAIEATCKQLSQNGTALG